MIDDLEFDSVSDLVSKVVGRLSDSPLWFRGQPSNEYKLTPKLMRGPSRPMDEVYQREARLVARFRERSLPFWPAGYPQQPWEHLFSMQHHGVPTRLLDWSENLLVATYFAATTPPSQSEGKPTVWTLDPLGWNSRVPQLSDTGIGVLTVADDEAQRWEPATSTGDRLAKRAKYPVALYGVHNSPRIVAQRGTFTIAGDTWLGMDELPCDDTNWAGYLTKYVFSGSSADLMNQLRFLGFTESMIFPDLSSLAAELTILEGWPSDG
ncbi:FRG domain-containing protein [Williamsia soli]|uniref:FRG domain-containing protein n=1 Tax=Williamsia soli TaxID=364929 RepID=UPI001A9D40A4|nr:FRG domain-containing protein [Williamsia soli]